MACNRIGYTKKTSSAAQIILTAFRGRDTKPQPAYRLSVSTSHLLSFHLSTVLLNSVNELLRQSATRIYKDSKRAKPCALTSHKRNLAAFPSIPLSDHTMQGQH